MNLEERPWYYRWLSQCKLLLWKNWKTSIRNKKTTIIQLATPAIFIIIIYLLQLAIQGDSQFGNLYETIRHPPIQTINNIPLCTIGPKSNYCYTFIYSPINDSEVEKVVDLICNENIPPIPRSSVKAFINSTYIDQFLFENQNISQAAIIFNFHSNKTNNTNNNITKNYDYILQVNITDQFSSGILISYQTYIEIPMAYAIERAILKVASNNSNLQNNVSLIKFAHPVILKNDIIGSEGPFWFYAALIFNFVVGLGNIVTERENKLREIMKMMGLYDSVYWITWFITLFIFGTSTVLILIAFGCIFQFDFFLHNAFGLYFFLLWLFALSMVSLTCLVSTLVKKAGNATNVGFVVFIIGYFIQLGALVIFSNSSSQGLRNLFSLFSPSLLQVGLSYLGQATAKSSYPGLRWSQRGDPTAATPNGVISFNQMYIWLFFDSVLYLLLALYFDNVLVNDYGVRRPLFYCCMPSYWSGKNRPKSKKLKNLDNLLYFNEEEMKNIDEDVKVEEKSIREGNLPSNTVLKIVDLTKIYSGEMGNIFTRCCKNKKPYIAVKKLCLSAERDTVLCLLGPNGAGKTTTIHMLVGFHESSGGDALIFGNSINTNLNEIQKIMGICPQFDILWNDLTGEEHLKLFAGLRDIPSKNIPNEVSRLLKEVELVDASKLRSSAYSGGMRRRLSVAIAFIGNPKIVFLDEPTTGMDPISRRKVWDVIERAKKGKIIILTTHSMEEADILGDKIAIMSKGRLQCVGSSLRLKQRFGAGYRITIGAKNDIEVLENIKLFFENNLPNVKLSGSTMAGYMNFLIPRESTEQLVEFFKKLSKANLGIRDIQLSLTTLEEVFLNVAENAEFQELKTKIDMIPNNNQTNNENLKDIESQKILTESRIVSKKDQFKALFIKSAILQKRDKKTVACQVLTPFILMVLLYILTKILDSILGLEPIPQVMKPPVIAPFNELPMTESNSTFFFELQVNKNIEVQYLSQHGTQFFYSNNPNDSVILGNYSTRNGLLGKINPPPGMPFNTKFVEFSSTELSSADATYQQPDIPIKFDFHYFESKNDIDDAIFNAFYGPIPYVVGGYLFNQLDFTNNQFNWSIFYNHSLTNGDDVPFLMNRITNVIAQSLSTPFNLHLIGVKSMPSQASDNPIDISTLAGAFFYCLILLQLLPVFLSNIVYEKESRIKEMMSMMGLNINIYWTVHYIFDYILYIFLIIFFLIAAFIFRFRVFTINNFLSYFILFLIWGHTLIAMSFLFSIFFSSKKTSLIVGYFLVIIFTLLGEVVVQTLVGNLQNVSSSVKFGLSIIPPFALYRGLVYIDDMVSYNGPGYSLSDLNNNVVNLVDVYGFLIVEWIVMLLLWWYLEQVIPSGIGIKKHPLFFLGFKKEKNIDISPETDNKKIPDDVKYENEKVLEVDAKEKYSILVQNITKVYPSVDNNPPKVAVKGISFGVETNVCLGILGHNGAGKTTLIQMLTGFFEPTSGTAFINGKNIIGEIGEIHAIMGICPQHDILWDQLTGKEHLMFYGRIKGLKGKILKEEVKKTLQKVNLYDARNKVSRAYSGGMKRRLSVAISIIGFPKVIFLDEPSTGLDPKSRQDLWKVISETKKESTIILTTHSMEEADALCDKITIMSEGEMKCIGVSADLKKRFGSGFKLSIQVEKGYDTEPASQFIHKLFPHCVLINEISGTKNFQIPKKEVFLEHIFEEMEKNKKELHITDWAITNTTLEEVFLAISGEGPMISKEDENNNNDNNQTNGNNINNYFSDDSD